METENYTARLVTIDDYDDLLKLWNSTEQSRRALNPIDDSRDGIERYLRRNPNTCFAAVKDDRIIGVIPDRAWAESFTTCASIGNPATAIAGAPGFPGGGSAEERGNPEGIRSVFVDNEEGNRFWEKQGYSLRTNLNYRNKSLNEQIPAGE